MPHLARRWLGSDASDPFPEQCSSAAFLFSYATTSRARSFLEKFLLEYFPRQFGAGIFIVIMSAKRLRLQNEREQRPNRFRMSRFAMSLQLIARSMMQAWRFLRIPITALLGPNGSGKSTLLNIILGLFARGKRQDSIARARPAPRIAVGEKSRIFKPSSRRMSILCSI